MIDKHAREILDVARGILGDLDSDAVLARLLDAAREITGAEYAALGVLDPTNRVLERFVTAGIDEATVADIGPPPTGRGVLGELIAHPTPLRLPDVGSHPHSYGFPVGHPPMTSFLGVRVTIAGQPFGNLYLTNKAGGEEFSDEDEEALVILAAFAGAAIDHARRFTSSEVRRNELQRTVDALDASIQIARALGGLTDITGILEMVAKRGRALVAARALISELTDGVQLIMSAAAGEVPPSVVGRRIDLQDTVASTALRTARTQRLEDEPNRARFQRHGAGRLGFDVTAGLVVPLVFRGHPYGVLVAVDRVDHGPVFTAADQRLLEAFATSAATAVATANSAATERRSQHIAATEQERTRWARELHDETLQGLAALRLGLDSAQRTGDPEVIARVVGQTVSQLGVEIEGLRSLITDLRPMLLDQLGPAAAIEALADRARQEGLEIDVSIELESEWHQGPGGIPPEVETAMYRVVQEGLTNARKHGQARRVVVEISELRGVLHITVRDDGTGFDVAAETEGFGLVGMRERAELLEGALGVQSAPGKGTTITVTFPSRRPTVSSSPQSQQVVSADGGRSTGT